MSYSGISHRKSIQISRIIECFHNYEIPKLWKRNSKRGTARIPFFLSHLKKSLFIHLTLARCQYLYKKAVISDFGRKSHRYEKKTVFDILGVVYEYTTSNPQVA